MNQSHYFIYRPRIFVQGFQQRGVKFLGVVDLKVGREFGGKKVKCTPCAGTEALYRPYGP